MVAKENISAFFDQRLPKMPDEVKHYLADLLKENVDEMGTEQDLTDMVGDHIQASLVDGMADAELADICRTLFDLLHDGRLPSSNGNGTLSAANGGVLEARKEMDKLWKVTPNDVPQQSAVDQKKLAKAEGKSKEKAQKRAEGGAGQQTKKVRPQVQATASQALNRRDAKGEVGTMDIKLENLDISFGNKQLINSADLLLVYGRRYGLVGRNGIGKTTLLKMISCKQLIIPSNITMLSVEQEVEGDDTPVIDAVLASDTRREALLAEERELTAKLNSCDVSDEEKSEMSARLDALFAEQQNLQLDKAPARAATILFGLGFKPDEQRKPTREFSGGWRMRVALARALFIKPDLLLLDEPTNMLDMRAVYWLENHLQEWPGTILTVSHDRKFLNTVCTDIVHLHSRRLDAYKGNYDNFEKAMCEKLTLQQREYEAQHQLRQHIQEFIDKFRYNAKRASMVQSRIKMLEKMPALQPVEFESDVVFHFKECEKLGNPVLQLDDVSFRYSKESPFIFQKVCIGSRSDSRICIVGENGAGKTTLLKLLLGDHSVTSGTRSANRRLNIGYFTQHHVDQLEMDDSPLELLAHRFPGLGQEEYRSAMGRFGLSGDIAFQSIATLSGGQKSRLAFTCLSLQQPNYLIMDEPTNHLDVETVDALGKALNNFKGGVVLVSHDERLIQLVCRELWVCKDKTVTQLDGGLEEYKKHVYRQLAIQEG
uniref:ABC transporter domain-containing protein n=2 Tax=Globodera TaxID=31242 RepID=A0A914H6S7_GLORO